MRTSSSQSPVVGHFPEFWLLYCVVDDVYVPSFVEAFAMAIVERKARVALKTAASGIRILVCVMF